MRGLPFGPSSISQTARILIEPLPVVYASLIPCCRGSDAPVGKSGPLMCFIRTSEHLGLVAHQARVLEDVDDPSKPR